MKPYIEYLNLNMVDSNTGLPHCIDLLSNLHKCSMYNLCQPRQKCKLYTFTTWGVFFNLRQHICCFDNSTKLFTIWHTISKDDTTLILFALVPEYIMLGIDQMHIKNPQLCPVYCRSISCEEYCRILTGWHLLPPQLWSICILSHVQPLTVAEYCIGFSCGSKIFHIFSQDLEKVYH